MSENQDVEIPIKDRLHALEVLSLHLLVAMDAISPGSRDEIIRSMRRLADGIVVEGDNVVPITPALGEGTLAFKLAVNALLKDWESSF